ncbi:ADP-ribosylation factor-like protein 16 [Liolophura sinensis]|uniref:ADP-ribosylation factor-like protein 16 n=1 Tax=Liolophura sinensis TaxID=3198878 RepID=UPI00315885B8
MCLLIGPTGVGKTLLLKRLSSIGKGAFENLGQIPSTIATVGSNLVTVNIHKKHDITIRELGGSMGPIWQNYYKDCKTVIYMIDVCNRLQVSSACIQLLALLTHESLLKTPILLIFNKIDMPTRMTKSEIEALFRLQDIIKSAQQVISVVEISVHTGHGVQDVIKWIQKAQK